MPLLEIDFECLCLFAHDETNGDVHVLMPSTTHHEKHVVRMFHRSFTGPGEQQYGRDMEGWALVLGEPSATADTSLRPATHPPDGPELPDLQQIAGAAVERSLLQDAADPRVAARVTLHSGRVTDLRAEARWEIGGRTILLAHKLRWEIVGVPHQLDWRRLSAPADAPVPLETLMGLATEEEHLGYRLRIRHVTENALESGALLRPEVMKQHFRAFYEMLGITPTPDMLPAFIGPPAEGVNCGGSKAPVAPPSGG